MNNSAKIGKEYLYPVYTVRIYICK